MCSRISKSAWLLLAGVYRKRGRSQFCGMSVPSLGSTTHGPLLPRPCAVKCDAALAGVAGEPSSGCASTTGAAGKSVQLAHGRARALQSVVAALLPLDPNPPLLPPLPLGSLNDSPSSVPPVLARLEHAAAAGDRAREGERREARATEGAVHDPSVVAAVSGARLANRR